MKTMKTPGSGLGAHFVRFLSGLDCPTLAGAFDIGVPFRPRGITLTWSNDMEWRVILKGFSVDGHNKGFIIASDIDLDAAIVELEARVKTGSWLPDRY